MIKSIGFKGDILSRPADELAAQTITYNPYEGVDFTKTVKFITHEHNLAQASFERCYNRGIRFIPVIHYQPSITIYPLNGWFTTYEDWINYDALGKETKASSGAIANFTDAELNNIDVSTIPTLPATEFVNTMESDLIHFNIIGSLYSNPGWAKISGEDDPAEGIVVWRKAHMITTPAEIVGAAKNAMLYTKLFGTINHPEASFSNLKSIIDLDTNIFLGFEVFSGGYDDVKNADFNSKYNQFLSRGYKIWAVAVVDWQNSWGGDRTYDTGCCIAYVSENYDTNTKANKEKEILDCMVSGRFSAAGLGSLNISSLSVSASEVVIEFTKTCDEIKIISNIDTTTIESSASANKNIFRGVKWVRFEARIENDFLISQPIFFGYK